MLNMKRGIVGSWSLSRYLCEKAALPCLPLPNCACGERCKKSLTLLPYKDDALSITKITRLPDEDCLFVSFRCTECQSSDTFCSLQSFRVDQGVVHVLKNVMCS